MVRRLWAAPKTWITLLGVLNTLAAVFVVFVFMPGGSNTDSIWQRKQILGIVPLSDWHPPIMTVVWLELYRLTGTQATLLFVQVGLLFACSWGFSCYLFSASKSRKASLLGSGFLLLPYMFTHLGVLWKDTEMACALFLAFVCVLLASKCPRLHYPLLLVAFFAVVYGTVVRKNAFFAVIPLVYLVYKATAERSRKVRSPRVTAAVFSGFLAGVLVAVLAISSLIAATYQPLKTHQESQVMLDDVIFTVPATEIRNSDVKDGFKQRLLEAQAQCAERKDYEDSYWRCYGRGADGIYTAIADRDQLQKIWLQKVVTRPDRYLAYRIQTFSHFLFDNYRGWDGDIHASDLGAQTTSPQLNDAGKTYVIGMGNYFPWVFSGAFWLTASIVALAWRRKIRKLEASSGFTGLTRYTTALSASALIYILGYFPIVPANHFRYLYWSAMAMTVVAVLLIAAKSTANRRGQLPPAVSTAETGA